MGTCGIDRDTLLDDFDLLIEVEGIIVNTPSSRMASEKILTLIKNALDGRHKPGDGSILKPWEAFKVKVRRKSKFAIPWKDLLGLGLPKKQFMEKWVLDGKKPRELQKLLIANRAGVSYSTIGNWFCDTRKRLRFEGRLK